MKIAYLASKFPPIVGGGETQIFLLATHMAKLGHDVTVITDESVKRLANRSCQNGFKIHYISGFEDFCTSGNCFKVACNQIFNDITTNEYQVIHAHNIMPMFLLSIFRKSISAKVVFTFHNTPDPPKRILGYFDNFTLDHILARYIVESDYYDLLVLGSKFYYDWAINLGSNTKKTELVYMGIDKSVFYPPKKQEIKSCRDKFGITTDDFVLTFPSRMIKRKGIFELLNAFSLLIKGGYSGLKLFLPASYSPFDSSCYQEAKVLIDTHELSDYIIEPTKLISYNDMPCVYAASDLVVMPSYYEGLGLAILESMAMGIPVVATNVCGINEIVINNKNGLLVENQNVGQLFQAIQKVYKNSNLRRRFSVEGINTVTDKFNITAQVQKLNIIYNRLYG